MLGVKPEVFAYPCGQTYIGRGKDTQSYVPLVAELFLTGRGWLDEGPNDPTFCDFSQLTGMESDGKDFEDIQPILEAARSHHDWIVFAGHEMGDSGTQTTRLEMLKKLIAYAQDPAHGIWIALRGYRCHVCKAAEKITSSGGFQSNHAHEHQDNRMPSTHISSHSSEWAA